MYLSACSCTCRGFIIWGECKKCFLFLLFQFSLLPFFYFYRVNFHFSGARQSRLRAPLSSGSSTNLPISYFSMKTRLTAQQSTTTFDYQAAASNILMSSSSTHISKNENGLLTLIKFVFVFVLKLQTQWHI